LPKQRFGNPFFLSCGNCTTLSPIRQEVALFITKAECGLRRKLAPVKRRRIAGMSRERLCGQNFGPYEPEKRGLDVLSGPFSPPKRT